MKAATAARDGQRSRFPAAGSPPRFPLTRITRISSIWGLPIPKSRVGALVPSNDWDVSDQSAADPSSRSCSSLRGKQAATLHDFLILDSTFLILIVYVYSS